jgi:hypothetical protein
MYLLVSKNQHLEGVYPHVASQLWARNILVVVAVFLLGLVSFREVYQSFYRHPFLIGEDCFLYKPLTHDRWTSGVYMIDIPKGAHGVDLFLQVDRPYLKVKPLSIDINVINVANDTFARSSKVWSQSKAGQITVSLPSSTAANIDLKARMRLSSCFSPRNLGISVDGRVLGVQVETVTLF